ncbi:MAG: kynureninase, partial [Gemmatimonadota bacterium]
MTHSSDEAYARRLDAEDPLAAYPDRFHIPAGPDGAPAIYLCGNSLGLMPRAAREVVEQELHDWETLGVEGHFQAKSPWYSYHEQFRESGARLVGAKPGEVVMMNGLTVNLHLMMASFYRPTPERHKILVEAPAFPSDRYAVQSQLVHHGYGAEEGLVVAKPRPGEDTLRTEDLEALLAQRGAEIALVLLGAVNFHTGQLLAIPRITAAAK